MAGSPRLNELLLIAALGTGKIDRLYSKDRRAASGRKAAACNDSGRWDNFGTVGE